MLNYFRRIARITLDSIYCKNIVGKVKIGTKGDSWTIVERSPIEIVYSGGVGKDISFELEMIERYGSKVYTFDPSPTGIKTINNLIDKPNNLKFYPIGLSNKNETVKFNYPENSEEGSFVANSSDNNSSPNTIIFDCKSISTLMRENKHIQIDILKIDIEGSEYGVIDDIIVNKLEIKQICVEFHHFFDNIPKSKTIEYIDKLKNCGYILFHKVGTDYSFIKV